MTQRKDNPNGGTTGAGKTPGSGRKKGTVNKHTAELKAMIEQALSDAGGVTYLVWAAKEEPSAFLALLGKTLPKDLNLGGGVSLEVNLVSRR